MSYWDASALAKLYLYESDQINASTPQPFSWASWYSRSLPLLDVG